MSHRKAKNRKAKLEEYQVHCSSLVVEDTKGKKLLEDRMKLNDKIIRDIKIKTKTDET